MLKFATQVISVLLKCCLIVVYRDRSGKNLKSVELLDSEDGSGEWRQDTRLSLPVGGIGERGYRAYSTGKRDRGDSIPDFLYR